MSPQKQLSNFVDTLLLAYVLTSNNADTQKVKRTIIEDYKKLNDKCDSVLNKIKERKIKSYPPPPPSPLPFTKN